MDEQIREIGKLTNLNNQERMAYPVMYESLRSVFRIDKIYFEEHL
jgi:hypothetical protein